MRILVIRLSSLGDVLLATPVVRLLRGAFPAAQIDVAVAQDFAAVWEHNPYVSRIIAVDRSLDAWRMARTARAAMATQYDVIVDLQRNIRSSALRWGRARRVLRSPKYRLQKLLVVKAKRTFRPMPHVVERYLGALEPLGIADDGGGVELWLPEERSHAVYPPVNRQPPADPTIGIAPGARHNTKRWLPSGFAAVAQTLQCQGWRVIALGSKSERDLCETVVAGLDRSRTLNAAGSSLEETARLLDQCTLVLSNDSAAVHLAAARRVPVVVVYGSTVPTLGFTPYHVPYRAVEVELSCRPCTHIGRSACPRGHFGCMQYVTPNDVLRAIASLEATTAGLGGGQSR